MAHSPFNRFSVLFAALYLGAQFGPVAPAAQAAGVTFTLTVKSAFLRSAPTFSAPRAYSIFQGQAFAALARTPDNTWFQLEFAGAGAEAAWVWAAYGNMTGDPSSLPAVTVPTQSVSSPVDFLTQTPPTPRVSFTLVNKSAYLRSAPAMTAPRAYSIFRGQTFRVSGQNPDGTWVQLDYPGATTEAWIPLGLGTLRGDLAGVPVYSLSAVPPTPVPSTLTPAGVLPAISARAKEIYQLGLAAGNDSRAFSKIGDCMSVNPYYLAPFDDPREYRLGPAYAGLQDTITQFAGSFRRDSQAAHIGFNPQSVFDPIWANPRICTSGETPIECEFRLHRPSLVLVSLGTNGEWLSNEDYEAAMRRILDFTLARGTLPILGTKADDIEGGGRFNDIVIRLAAEYQIPLWNFRAAVETLPRHGIASQSTYQLTWGRAVYDGPASTWTGWQWRNLTALQSLDLVWKTVR